MKTKFLFQLSILLITVLLMPNEVIYVDPPFGEGHFRLQANAGWADSGVQLKAGEEVRLLAYGQAITARINVFGPASVSGPDGQQHICPNYVGAPACAMDNAPYGALVGKIGQDGEAFLIGASSTFTPETDGELFLAVNDLLPYYADNYGNYMVFFNP